MEILEQGAISFLAVARPANGDAGAARDVAHFFVVLAPGGRRPLRRLAVRRRRLPEPERGQRFYAHVDRLAIRAARLTDDVRGGPRARRVRVLAVGRYTLARHDDHVHLAYALARSCGRGVLARALGVRAAASFLLCVFRRSLPPPRRPAGALALAAATPDRLDVLGAEIALVAGARDGDGRLGIPARGPADRVGETLAGALLRRGPRPRIASMARA